MFKVICLKLLMITLFSCNKNQEIMVDSSIKQIEVNPNSWDSLSFLPENLVAFDSLRNVTVRYILPTTRYPHGILGDNIEGGGLHVKVKNEIYQFVLDPSLVFEDIVPRLYDIDGDGQLEFICIVSNTTKGAGIVVFKIVDKKLIVIAESDFIGTPNRWLNIAAINDLDNDGRVEIAWVQTPHIGGTLKIANIENKKIEVKSEISGVSNHKIGSRNLCLSVIESKGMSKTLWLPTNDYSYVWGFVFANGKISKMDEKTIIVNSEKPLYTQLNFNNIGLDSNCCTSCKQ